MMHIRKLGILGGSFDPPHLAHLEMASIATEKFALDKILFVPCFQNPLKDIMGYASPYHRYVMCQLATLTEENYVVTPIELNRGGESYTIDTLTELSKTGYELYFILGMDAYLSINEWKDVHRFHEFCRFIVFSRDIEEHPVNVPDNIRKVTSIISGFDIDISSTEIRKSIRNGENTDREISTLVKVYIQKYELYQHFRDQNRLVDKQPEKYFLKWTE